MVGVPIAQVCGGSASAHCMAIAEDGRVFTWGRNETGQLGHGDLGNRSAPTVVKALEGVKVVSGSCGKNHTVVVTDTGASYAWGSNKHGQLGVGAIARTKPKEDDVRLVPVLCTVANASAVACGAEFTMWIAGEGGALYSCGLPQYGQLGHGEEKGGRERGWGAGKEKEGRSRERGAWNQNDPTVESTPTLYGSVRVAFSLRRVDVVLTLRNVGF